MISKLMTSLFLVVSSSSMASEAVNISCGDHWFAVDVIAVDGNAVVSVSGDSVVGEELAFEAAMNQRVDATGAHFVFIFGDASQQTLSVSFDSEAHGEGIYSESPDGQELYLSCTRR